MRPRNCVLIALLAGGACTSSSDLTRPDVIQADLPGTWSQSAVVPGSATNLHLSVNENTITGDGTYAVEAGMGGTLTVVGHITAGRVILDVTRSDGAVAHYDATLATPDLLRGELSYNSGPAFVTEFHRVSH